MAPVAVDIPAEQTPGNGSRKSAKKDGKVESPTQASQGSPTPGPTDGLEEFDRFFNLLHEQHTELESNLVSGLNAQKSLEQRHAELQSEHKKREDELAAARSEIEKLKEDLAKREREVAARDAELEKSNDLAKKLEAEKKGLDSKISEMGEQLKLKEQLVEDANEKAQKAVEEKEEGLRAAEKRVQRILAYAQSKVSEVVDKNQELLKKLHGSL
ncbi:hypothetical protein VUR80DRAFT_7247 [Thermomyces stellatus]